MSLKNSHQFLFPKLTVTNANIASAPLWADNILRASFQFVFTGTPTGTLQLQWSNDMSTGLPANQFVPANWTNLGSSVAVAAAGIFAIPYQEFCYEYLRVLYTDGSSGASTATFFGTYKVQGL